MADSVAVLTGFSPVKGNTMKVTKAGEEYMEWLLDDVKNATTSIEIEYYWFDTDKAGHMLRATLMEKAREGVAVR
ncbi:MAG: cardiolipin synthase, partial [Clostridia bacterium]|nr:cardiolipin synthase [Clostridia bacterium]